MGMFIPEPGAIRYLRPSSADAAEAARRLRDGELGSTGYVAAEPIAAPVDAAPVETTPVASPEAVAPVAEDAAAALVAPETAAATTPAAPAAPAAPVGGGVAAP